MNIYDIVILIPITAGLIFGFSKGFVKEVVSLGGIILAIIVAEIFSGRAIPFVQEYLNTSEKATNTVAYILVFVATVIVAMLIGKIIEKMLSGLSLAWLNALLGGVFGALKFAILMSIVMNIFDSLDERFRFSNPEKKETSMAYYPLLKLSPTLWEEAKTRYEDYKQRSSEKTYNLEDALKNI